MTLLFGDIGNCRERTMATSSALSNAVLMLLLRLGKVRFPSRSRS